MNKVLLLISISLLCSCSTIAPPLSKSDQPYPDSSTPKQYDEFNSGIIYSFTGHDGKIYWAITQNKAALYKKTYGDSGLIAFNDEFGNSLWAISNGNLSKWHNDLKKAEFK